MKLNPRSGPFFQRTLRTDIAALLDDELIDDAVDHQPTPEAIHVFYKSHAKKIGLFHVTC